MCYSAEVWADYRLFVRHFGAVLDVKEFYDLYWRRLGNDGATRPKTPRGMETPFLEAPRDENEARIKALIEESRSTTEHELQAELFAQRKRLADADRSLEAKLTKAATESKRIASDKVERALARLEDLKRTEPRPRDSRIFPGMYAPVMVIENGQLTIKPMRYQCRPAGKPASYDRQYPGTYNARRDNLQGFWRGQFGVTHGVMVATAFYENVKLHDMQHRPLREGEEPTNVVLEFRPQEASPMLIACLWSEWKGKDGEALLSFAAVTDEPPPEVAAAGHDRCIVSLREENLDRWLNPKGATFDHLDRLLEDKQPAYYEHREAA